MKRIILTGLLSLTMLTGAYASAQDGPAGKGPSREQVIQQKRAFLTRELELSEQEINALMPILEELDVKRFQLWKESESTRRRIQSKDASLTESDLRRYFEQQLEGKVREAELERTYYTRCKDALPISKLVHLERTNRKFAREFFGKDRGQHRR